MPRDSLPITHKLLTSLCTVGNKRASLSGTSCSPALAATLLMMSEPSNQHIVPKTYLKRFAIDPLNRKLKSMVWTYWKDKRETKLKTESIDSDKFKKPDFYTIDNETDPFVFENYFKTEIEPLYNEIIGEIALEKSISLQCRTNLILWLYNNKYRNKANRDNLERNLLNMIRFTQAYQFGMDKFNEIADEIGTKVKGDTKNIHLESLVGPDLIVEFEKGMGTKHWIILKSRSENKFISNDNPGFSINIDLNQPDFRTLTHYYATNNAATNYYPLSPDYCLMISPYWEGTPLETSLRNQTIEFKITNNRHIDFINACTALTRTKYLVSQSKELLEKIKGIELKVA
jgi:hypothetical protein